MIYQKIILKIWRWSRFDPFYSSISFSYPHCHISDQKLTLIQILQSVNIQSEGLSFNEQIDGQIGMIIDQRPLCCLFSPCTRIWKCLVPLINCCSRFGVSVRLFPTRVFQLWTMSNTLCKVSINGTDRGLMPSTISNTINLESFQLSFPLGFPSSGVKQISVFVIWWPRTAATTPSQSSSDSGRAVGRKW